MWLIFLQLYSLKNKYSKIEDTIHVLKGVSANIGAYRISNILKELELFIQKREISSFFNNLDDAKTIFKKSLNKQIYSYY